MRNLLVFASVLLVELMGSGAEAGPYLFAFSGEAVPHTENNALTGAQVSFSFVIDSEAEPDMEIPDFQAWYFSSIQDPKLMISNSESSDGVYGSDGAYFDMIVANTDIFFEDYVLATQSPEGVFEIPGTNGIYVRIFLWDPSTDALDGTEVPIDISLDDFSNLQFWLRTPEGGGSQDILFTVPDFEMTITPVPEPTSLLLLALGGAGVLFRRRAGM